MASQTVTLNANKLRRAMQRAGFESYAELLRKAGVHRNTLYHYFTGKRDVVAAPLQRLANVLQVDCLSLLEGRGDDAGDEDYLIRLLNQAAQGLPEAAFVLLGSRAKGTEKRYSDWDVGISSGQSGTVVDSYLNIKGLVQDLTENWLYKVDVINLDAAPAWFLSAIDYKPRFLTGNRDSYHYLLGVLHGSRHSAAAA